MKRSQKVLKKGKKPPKSKYQQRVARRALVVVEEEPVVEAVKAVKAPEKRKKPIRKVSGNMRKHGGGGVRNVAKKYTRAETRSYMLGLLQKLSDANHITFRSLDENDHRVEIKRPGGYLTAYFQTGKWSWELQGPREEIVGEGRGLHTLLEALSIAEVRKGGSLGKTMARLGC